MVAKEFEDSSEALRFLDLVRKEAFIAWNLSVEGWVKCNVDGSSREGGTSVGCRGVIRDSNGKWILGFIMRHSHMDILSAKIWSISKGLEVSKEKGIRKIIIESDSKKAVELAGGECALDHPLTLVVHKIREKM